MITDVIFCDSCEEELDGGGDVTVQKCDQCTRVACECSMTDVEFSVLCSHCAGKVEEDDE